MRNSTHKYLETHESLSWTVESYTKVFRSAEEVKRAYRNGEICMNGQVEISG